MRALADVSWLLPLCHGGHEHHKPALAWLESLPVEGRITICRAAQLGLLRLLNNPAVMGSDALDGDQLWRLNDQLLGDSRFSFESEPPALEHGLRRLTQDVRHSPKLWQDAYLAAFAVAAGLQLVTFDKGFRKFPALHCVVLDPD